MVQIESLGGPGTKEGRGCFEVHGAPIAQCPSTKEYTFNHVWGHFNLVRDRISFKVYALLKGHWAPQSPGIDVYLALLTSELGVCRGVLGYKFEPGLAATQI